MAKPARLTLISLRSTSPTTLRLSPIFTRELQTEESPVKLDSSRAKRPRKSHKLQAQAIALDESSKHVALQETANDPRIRKLPSDVEWLKSNSEESLDRVDIAWKASKVFVVKKESTKTSVGVISADEQWYAALNPTAARDACGCSACRDPSSGQKSFESTDVPPTMQFTSVQKTADGLTVTLDKEIEGFEKDHKTVLPWSYINSLVTGSSEQNNPALSNFLQKLAGRQYWGKTAMEKNVRAIDYNDFMTSDKGLWNVVLDICRYGLVVINNIPREEDAVIDMTTRIANIKETFYGRTFDVRAKPNAENVAYTSGHLGLHQDLLYLRSPPRIQVLHCIDNSCVGGESLFSDGSRTGQILLDSHDQQSIGRLAKDPVTYTYDKNGHFYTMKRPLLFSSRAGFENVWWSPPFQGRPGNSLFPRPEWLAGASIFRNLVNHPSAVYERKLKAGECVLFDNWRVLHGRTAFDVEGGGSRWLRGAYIADEDFRSKSSVIPLDFAEAYRSERAAAEWNASEEHEEFVGLAKQMFNVDGHDKSKQLEEEVPN